MQLTKGNEEWIKNNSEIGKEIKEKLESNLMDNSFNGQNGKKNNPWLIYSHFITMENSQKNFHFLKSMKSYEIIIVSTQWKFFIFTILTSPISNTLITNQTI